MKQIVGAILVSLSFQYQAKTAIAEEVSGDYVSIEGLSAEGPGCSTKDSYAVNISPDGKAFTISFQELNVSMEQSNANKRIEVDCRIDIGLKVPRGWRYTISSMNYRGFVELDSGVNAGFISYYSIADRSIGRFKGYTAGPYQGEFVYTDEVYFETNADQDIWSTCGGDDKLTIHPYLHVERSKWAANKSTGQITSDSVDGEFRQEYVLAWEKCE